MKSRGRELCIEIDIYRGEAVYIVGKLRVFDRWTFVRNGFVYRVSEKTGKYAREVSGFASAAE